MVLKRMTLGGALGLMLAAAVGAQGTPVSGAKIQAIRDCIAANGPRQTLVQTLRIESFTSTGQRRRIRANLYYRRAGPAATRTTLQVRAPMDVAGTSYLLVDSADSERLFLYLPALDRTRLVMGGSAASSILGTDFSYAEMRLVRTIGSGEHLRQLPGQQVAGRPTHTLVLTPASRTGDEYRRVIFRIDQKTCVPLRIVYFGADEEPLKRYVADADSLVQVGGHWLATKATMHDLVEGSHTTLHIESTSFDGDVPDSVFHRRTFYLGRNLVPVQATPIGLG